MEEIRIILASASPRRKELMRMAGFDPEIIPSTGEEHTEETDPRSVVLALSAAKAENVALRCTAQALADSGEEKDPRPMLIVGSDTVVSAGGKILGKPKTHEEAAEMIRLLSGKTHEVYTGVRLIFIPFSEPPKRVSFAEKTSVTVYPMTEEEILSYAGSDEPMDKAGAYGIQGSFGVFVKGIRGDYNNVVGLPAARVYREIGKLTGHTPQR